MGCAGDCVGCGEPGRWQVHVTVRGRTPGAFPEGHVKLLTIGNLDRTGRPTEELIYTASGIGDYADAMGTLLTMRARLTTNILREKIEMSPSGVLIKQQPWLYRECHIVMPYTLQAWHAASNLGLPLSVNVRACHRLIATLRQYMTDARDWEALRNATIDKLPYQELREEYTVFDTDPFYDRAWLYQE